MKKPKDTIIKCAYCPAPVWKPAYICAQCKADRLPAHKRARSLLTKAVRDRKLPWADIMRCVDCAAPATLYEHRDYNKPLEVEPVCRSCNTLRGPAAWDRSGEVSLQSSLIDRWQAATAKYRIKRG